MKKKEKDKLAEKECEVYKETKGHFYAEGDVKMCCGPLSPEAPKECEHKKGSYEKDGNRFCNSCYDFMSPKEEDWREEFRKIAPYEINGINTAKYALQLESFIEKTLKEKLEEERGKIKEYIKENRHKVERIDRYVLDDIINLLMEEK